MARGNLYCIFSATWSVPEKIRDEVQAYFEKLSTGQDDDPALHHKAKKLCSKLALEHRADDTIEGLGNEADWLEDIDDWQDYFITEIRACDGTAFQFENYVIFRMSEANIESWFAPQFERLQQMVKGLSLSDFCKHKTSWALKDEISCRFSDAALYESCFCELDDAIRLLERDEWYIVSNAMLMH